MPGRAGSARDLKTFFGVIPKDLVQVTPSDVMAFVATQQQLQPGADNVVHFLDAGAGLSRATVMRRLAALSAFHGYLPARNDTPVLTNPVPRGLPARRIRPELRGAPLVRGMRRLPRILDPAEVAALRGTAHAPGPAHRRGDVAWWAAAQ